ncbi:hypothetical protein AMAG_03108 [Allomyces macrogynus ATCC 38327]|uniref:Uncharacterized protein n=1 Tax=Allomyces macrogynus (strain ATCC 38327) TaxID=578462 RepID=A0A0L0S4N1_ALLM3|nr:hypothetical protein AMAG_03108 [Allomyces macrogynus ATCC 38327]|eukprot:KNE57386.1 hypothetical protein AMAG_03108 [Allomyces macrogynus ATCC 38327]
MDLAKNCLPEQVHQDTTHTQRSALPAESTSRRALMFLSSLTDQTPFVTSSEIIARILWFATMIGLS